MALYKEVQEQYEQGLKIPDDMTLLFADDNFGSIRRLPTAEERKRSGGAGVSFSLVYLAYDLTYVYMLIAISFITTFNIPVFREATAG